VKKLLLGLVLALAGLMAILQLRASRLAAVPEAVTLPDSLALDPATAGSHLAQALTFRTVSLESGGPVDTAAFRQLHLFLETTYPMVHQQLSREVIGGLSLLFTWQGRDASLAPVVLMAHQDVVPVTPEALDRWTHPPFAGQVADGFVWGRGAMDDKAGMIGIFEAVEALLSQGFQPARTIYLAFGHDEEVGGVYGAGVIADTLRARGMTSPAMVLDEGGALSEGMAGLAGPVALIGVAEKGYVTLQLKVDAEGGHSSMPPRETAIGILSTAITRLEAHPFPPRLTPAVQGMFEQMAPAMSGSARLAMANLWLFKPLVIRRLLGTPQTASMLRTTTAPTVFHAGVKDNVLPQSATASVNFRLLTGDTRVSVLEAVRRTVADDRVEVTEQLGMDPSPVSQTSGPAFDMLAATIRQSAAGRYPVVPFLVMGGTDAKYYAAISDRVYRFMPWRLGQGDFERVHGTDERLAVAAFADGIRFYARLIRNSDGL
jgi:carboxypeptidase PM20D1